MALFLSRRSLRWMIPTGVAASALVAVGATSMLSANAAPSLPERSAEQLLVDLQNAQVEPFSGTVTQKANLGLPNLPSAITDQAGPGGATLTSLLSGDNTVQVWYGGEHKAKVALPAKLGSTEFITNGTETWVWSKDDNTATKHSGGDKSGLPIDPSPTGLPSTPSDVTKRILDAITPTTKVFTDGTAEVAGRDAYELVLAPKDTTSRIGQVRLAVDAEKKVPLRVRVFARDDSTPAFEVGFSKINFGAQADSLFTFTPPAGAKVEQETEPSESGKPSDGDKPSESFKSGQKPTVVGESWTSVLVAKGSPLPATGSDSTLDALLGSFPKVSGDWGSGRLFSSKLFTVLLTDDGRILAGAVDPERLYEVAATK